MESDKESGELSSQNNQEQNADLESGEEGEVLEDLPAQPAGAANAVAALADVGNSQSSVGGVEKHHHHYKKEVDGDSSDASSISGSKKGATQQSGPKDSTLFQIGKQIVKTKKKNKKRKNKTKKILQKRQQEANKKVNNELSSSSSSEAQSYTSGQESQDRSEEPLTHYLKYDLCKYFMANNCQRGEQHGTYSHQTKKFPCKWIHATGMCDKGENCRFSHNILTQNELKKFMKENEEFLEDRFLKAGKTNLGIFYVRFREEQAKLKNEIANPSSIMVPPGILQSEGQQQQSTNGVQQNNGANPEVTNTMQGATQQPYQSTQTTHTNSIMENYQQQLMMKNLSPSKSMAQPQVQPQILQAPDNTPKQQQDIEQAKAPQNPSQQQLALLQLQLLMSCQQMSAVQNQKKQAMVQMERLNQHLLQLSQVPNQQHMFFAIQLQLQSGQQTLIQLQGKINEFDMQIRNLENQQNELKMKINELQTNRIGALQLQQQLAATQQLQQMNLAVTSSIQKLEVQVDPQSYQGVQQQPPILQGNPNSFHTSIYDNMMKFNPQSTNQYIYPQPHQQPPPIQNAMNNLQYQQQIQQPPILKPQQQQQQQPQIQNQQGLYNLLGQLKQQVESKAEIDKRPEMKKIEADLQALINNKNFTGELNTAQIKMAERARNTTGGLYSSSSGAEDESFDTLSDKHKLPTKSKQKPFSQESHRSKRNNKQKCLFDDKRCFEDYDSDSLSIYSQEYGSQFQIKTKMIDRIFNV